MKKNGIEKNIVVILFVLVLVTFSFAEKESKKMERLYTVAQLLKNNSILSADVTAGSTVLPSRN